MKAHGCNADILPRLALTPHLLARTARHGRDNDVDQIREAACLAKSVYDSEKAAIDRRRKFIRERIGGTGGSSHGQALLFRAVA